jgi:AcrR family transcriptional regulator
MSELILTERAGCVNNPFDMPDAQDTQTADPAEKRSRILEAALEKFSAYGIARTSMADIAAAADMSRPALYLHFRNKEEIFRATLESVLQHAYENALEALAPARLEALADPELEEGIGQQLNEFLQRYHGDLMAAFTATTHGDDFLVAKNSHAADVVTFAAKRTKTGLTRFFSELAARKVFDPELAGQPATRWIELILLSPSGLKQDQPSVSQYRKRLEALAVSVASGMSGHRSRSA